MRTPPPSGRTYERAGCAEATAIPKNLERVSKQSNASPRIRITRIPQGCQSSASVDEHDGGKSPMNPLRDLWLPESHRRREEEMRARGVVVAVTGRDVSAAPMTDSQVRELASELVIETTIPLLVGVMRMTESSSEHDRAELRATQIRAARAFLASPLQGALCTRTRGRSGCLRLRRSGSAYGSPERSSEHGRPDVGRHGLSLPAPKTEPAITMEASMGRADSGYCSRGSLGCGQRPGLAPFAGLPKLSACVPRWRCMILA